MNYNKIIIHDHSPSSIYIECDYGIKKEIWEHFSFLIPNAKFNPKVKAKVWDGYIRIFSFKTSLLPKGLKDELIIWALERGYEYEATYEDSDVECSVYDVEQFIKTLDIPEKFEIRDYQLQSIAHCIRKRRAILLSPTSSGKSFIIYILMRWFKTPSIIVVPTTALVEQMYNDFKSYGFDVEKYMSRISGDYKDRSNLKPFVVATWQTLKNLPASWFAHFQMVVVDEAHEAKATSIKNLMEQQLAHVDIRFGTTGTLDDLPVNLRILVGMFGPVKSVIKTHELIEQGYISDILIRMIILEHDQESRKYLSGKKTKDYKTEVEYLISHEERNNHIAKLATSLKGNVLILFNYVERHGDILLKKISELASETDNVFYVHGNVKTKDRMEIIEQADTTRNNKMVCSFGTFQRGISIINIDYIIFAFPYKAKIRNLQSIGRGLRKGPDKQYFELFDFGDDLTWGARENHTFKHAKIRLKTYVKEKFKYKVYKVKIS